MSSFIQTLEKNKRLGWIDYLEVPRRYGTSYKEFIGISFGEKAPYKKTYFFRFWFHNGKYKEDYYTCDKYPMDTKKTIENEIVTLEEKLKIYIDGYNIKGIFNTKYECDNITKQLDFYKKYLSTDKLKNT